MRWSIELFRFKGISVKLHLTFFFVLIWAAYSWYVVQNRGVGGALFGVVAITLLFLSVVIHEFAHSLQAIRFGARVKEIVLLPIGGVSRMESMPEKPGQEFVVAIVGPLTSFMIAGLLYVLGRVLGIELELSVDALRRILASTSLEALLTYLVVANIVLGVFNMLPAFPMDGGRVLRSLLAMRLGQTRATKIAVVVGEVMAFAMGFWGFMSGNIFLVLIAVFIFVGAMQEGRAGVLKAALKGIRVEDAYSADPQVLAPSDQVARAVALALHGFQSDFPIVDQGKVVGLLTKSEIYRAVHQHHPLIAISTVMRTDFISAAPGDSLFDVQQRMASHRQTAVPVFENNQLKGLLTIDDIGEAYRFLT